MNAISRQVSELASRQHDVVATWQLRRRGLSENEVDTALRGVRRVFRGVCALGDLTELGWFMAAALAMGPTAAISHRSALMLLGLRPYEEHDIHVSYIGGSGRLPRGGLIPHRRRHLETGLWRSTIPVTSPTQSLKDTDLEPYELYRAIEEATQRSYPLTLPPSEITTLHQRVQGRTKSDAEARALLLMHDHGIELPLVNQVVNGYEADFHWPAARLVLEVDGWEFHKERVHFEEDRYRTMAHTAAGWQVIRVSALQVRQEPEALLAAVSAGSRARRAGRCRCR